MKRIFTWFSSICDRVRWRIVSSTPIASITWSAIRRIGQSRLLSFTIVVPFLGSLLLFNQHVVDLLTLSPDLIRRWMKVPVDASEGLARQLTLSRLYYAYFGLTFLGVGSALFAMFCPQIVKSYASSTEYLKAESALVTLPRISLMVSDVSLHYSQWLGEENLGLQLPLAIRQMGEPHDFINLCSVAFVQMFEDLPPELFQNDENSQPDTIVEAPNEPGSAPAQDSSNEIEEEDPFNDPFYDHRGHPAPDRIAMTLINGHRALQWFVRAFDEVAAKEEHRKDMLALHYMALDNSKPRLRMFVAFFYGTGFIILAIPTLATFLQVALHVLH